VLSDREKMSLLMPKQLEGILLGYRPGLPRGAPSYLLKEWRRKVWQEWLDVQDLSGRHLPEGHTFHSNPN
jgi:hypothetical protein